MKRSLEMDLYVTPDRIYLKTASEILTIDRVSHEITIETFAMQTPQAGPVSKIYGILGVIRLIACPYLIVITGASTIGHLWDQPILKIETTDIIPFSKTTLHLTEEQAKFNSTYLQMVRSVLASEAFYYSTTYDLTHTLQRLNQPPPGFLTISMAERADPRFFWNAYLVEEFSRSNENLRKFCTPIMQGFVSVKNITLNGFTFTWALISRRSIKRAGCRLFMRGCDSDGNPANFVETEQIIEYSGGKCSFVQVRGSIPLMWSQLPNIKYKPPPVPTAGVNQVDVLRKHLDHLLQTYGRPIVLINLINHTGPEKKMEVELAGNLKILTLAGVKYEAFDFHHECRKMRWDRLSILMDRIKEDIQSIGFFQFCPDASHGGSRIVEQKGIFRTNCIDSLDRTNVVQGLIAKNILETQLRNIGVLQSGESITNHQHFDHIYRNVWADNADYISIQYSGTGALKTDYTRTGKRTRMGALKDGYYSVTRYFKNNFTDGFRQDSIDLFLGNYKVDPNEGRSVACPLGKKKDLMFVSLPLIFLGSIAMFFLSLLIPHEHSTGSFIFWLCMISIILMAIVFFGSEFVDFPKLTDVKSSKKKIE